MASDSRGNRTYNDVIDSVVSEITEPELTPRLQANVLQRWILEACQVLCESLQIQETRELLLITGTQDAYFNDTTGTVTGTGTLTTTGYSVAGDTVVGTGTISSSAQGQIGVGGIVISTATITGTGTAFITELAVGKAIVVSGVVNEILEIHSDTEAVVANLFTTNLVNSAFSVTKTKFSRELVVGSIITSSGQSKTVKTITNAMAITVETPFSPDLAAQAFTIDSVVTEIPTRFHRISKIDRVEGSFRREVKVVDMNTLLRRRVEDQGFSYTSYFSPSIAAEWRDGNGKRFLKFYPTPNANKSITLYADVRILPGFYASQAATSALPISEDYELLIKDFVKARIYKVYARNNDNYAFYMQSFANGIREMQWNIPNNLRTQVTYN